MRNHEDEQPPHFPCVGEQPVAWGIGNVHMAHDHKAIANPDTGKVFSIVSKDYRLIRHEKAIEEVEKAISKTPALAAGEREVTTDFYNDGGRMRRTYRFPDTCIAIEPGDMVNPVLHLFNSYDTTWPFIVTLGAFRLVCENGLVVHEDFLHVRRRHIYAMEALHLKQQVFTALQRFETQTKRWREWATLPLTPSTYDDVIKAMKLGKHALEEIGEKIERETEDVTPDGVPITTVWIFFNILCWYITHKAVSINHRVDMETRLRAAVSNHLKEVA